MVDVSGTAGKSPLSDRLRGASVESVSSHVACGVTLIERQFSGLVNLRGDANDAAFATAVGRLFGCELPRASNTWAAADSAIVCWLAPDEWLVVTQPGAAASLVARLEACLQTHDGAVNDLGAGHTIIRVGGEYGRTMLSKGCTVDLDARKFDVGCCAQSFIAKAPALILARTSGVVDVVVRRSFADYLLAWLRDAANEYGAQCGVEEGGP